MDINEIFQCKPPLRYNILISSIHARKNYDMYIPLPPTISTDLRSIWLHRNEIQNIVPHNDANTSAVKMPAPALPPVVIFILAAGSLTNTGLSPDEPAEGLPLLVPPESDVNGAATLLIKLA